MINGEENIILRKDGETVIAVKAGYVNDEGILDKNRC